MDRDRHIRENRFGPCGRDDNAIASICSAIAHVIKRAVDLFILFDFAVRKRGLAMRTPVDEPQASINEALIIELDENLCDCFAQAGIHREAIALPVWAEPERAKLLVDDVTVLLAPVPQPFAKFFRAKVVAGGGPFSRFSFPDGFCL